MASNRIGRINEEIQRELSALIRTVKDPRVKGLISITAVDTTSDLKYAKVYVSVLDKGDVHEVVKGLKSAAGYLRRELGRALQLHLPSGLVRKGDGPLLGLSLLSAALNFGGVGGRPLAPAGGRGAILLAAGSHGKCHTGGHGQCQQPLLEIYLHLSIPLYLLSISGGQMPSVILA